MEQTIQHPGQHGDTGCSDPLPPPETHQNVISFRKWQDKQEAAREAVETARLWAIKTWREREEHAEALEAFEEWGEAKLAEMKRTSSTD